MCEPARQAANLPACEQIVVIKGLATVFTYSEFDHDYVYGKGPFEARISGCCRPGAQTSEVQGLINNPGGPFKIAATVYLSSPTWAESPFFLQTPLVTGNCAPAVPPGAIARDDEALE